MGAKVKVKVNMDDFLDQLAVMAGDSFDANDVAVEGLPNPLDGYGLTKEDFERLSTEMMEKCPKETVLYVMYMSTRDYPDNHAFINEDALTPKELAAFCDDFFHEHVIYEGEDD